MAVVAPFRALRYDTEKVGDMTKVVSPPYDVINPDEQENYYQAEPHNIIRLELNKTRPTDDRQENRYTRAAAHLENWIEQGALAADPQPAFYISQTSYVDAKGQPRVRSGFFTLLKVEDFSKGVILPHEKTFTGHKEDRLQLTKATQANVSPIFALYPDEDNLVQAALSGAKQVQPVEDFVDPMGLPQKLFKVEDPEAVKRVQELMADKRIFIADGHHRYETAINYRNYMREQNPQAGPDAPFNFVLAYLCSMSDPGLTIFPCHRVLPVMGGFAARDFLLQAGRYFDYQELPLNQDLEADRDRITSQLAQAQENGNSLGLISAESDSAYILTLKKDALNGFDWADQAGLLQTLDVVVLTKLVLEHVLGFDENFRDQVHTIEYVSDMVDVMSRVRSGQARAAFLLNPTRVEQVEGVAKAGLIMPRKATYFYPKVLTGLVLYHMGMQGEISLP